MERDFLIPETEEHLEEGQISFNDRAVQPVLFEAVLYIRMPHPRNVGV
jgi:hypothetical protein